MVDALTRSMRASHLLVAVLAVASLVFAAVAAAMSDTFYLRLATEALIFAGLALSVDILLGYTGLLSLGQALYFGLGAYLSALVLMVVPSFWAAFGATARCLRHRRTDRRLHRAPRARRLFRAHHLRHGAGRRQGRLQHARTRRLRRTDRRSRHRHQSRRCIVFQRLAGRLLPLRSRAHRHPLRAVGLSARHAVRPPADRAARQRGAHSVPRLSHR